MTSPTGALRTGSGLRRAAGYAVVLALALAAPFLLPAFKIQLAMLWIMILFALTWDTMGGQMGYNSFGNILFFGVGMYATAVLQVGLFYDVGVYNAAQGAAGFELSKAQYFLGLGVGLGVAALLGVACAALLGSGMLGLRGHYFAIGTLGLGFAAGEIAAGWDWIGAGSGMVTPLFPGDIRTRQVFFYFLSFALCAVAFLALRRVYAGRFGLAINAIRDDEDKAEAMGLYTTRIKTVAWCISAFFLAMAGGIVGNIIGFIDPRDVAFTGATFGIWMVLMAILGGKGTLWGPVIGAVIFHVTQELFWTFLLGWQRVALGLLIVLIVVFFPRGIMGWLRERYPERFGQRVEPPAGVAAGQAAGQAGEPGR